jgi:Protein of unknown function (DUF4019)
MNYLLASLRLAALASTCITWGAHAQLKLPATPAAPSLGAQTAAPASPVDPRTAEKVAAGQAAASVWLQQLDAGQWRAAWDTSSQMFRSTVPLAQWMEGVPKLRQPLGAVSGRKVEDAAYKTTLPGRPDGEYVSVLFSTAFANKPGAEEVISTVREADGTWRVTGYSAR